MTPEQVDQQTDHEVDTEQWAALLLLLLIGKLRPVITDVQGVLDAATLGGSDRMGYRDRIGSLLADGYGEIMADARREFAELAAFEWEEQNRIMGLPDQPPPDSLAADVLGSPDQSGTLNDKISAALASAVALALLQLDAVILSGGGAADVASRWSGTVAGGGRDGEAQRLRRSIEGIVRAQTAHTVNRTRLRLADVYRPGAGGTTTPPTSGNVPPAVTVATPPVVLDRAIHVSVLDGRTSRICLARAGRVYVLPMKLIDVPPLHPSCRSRVWALKQGQAPPNIPTGAEWLRRQSPARQDEILGPTVGELFRSGDIELPDLIGPDLKPLTLDELRRRRRDQQ